MEIVEVQRGDGLGEKASGGQAGDGVGHGFAPILPARKLLGIEPDGRGSPPRFLGGPVPALNSQAIPYIYVAATTALAVVAAISAPLLDGQARVRRDSPTSFGQFPCGPGRSLCQPCPTGPNPMTQNHLESLDCLQLGLRRYKIRFFPKLRDTGPQNGPLPVAAPP